MSHVCRCRKGHRSSHDNKCGHCRTKADIEALNKYFRGLGLAQKLLREKYFGIKE